MQVQLSVLINSAAEFVCSITPFCWQHVDGPAVSVVSHASLARLPNWNKLSCVTREETDAVKRSNPTLPELFREEYGML